MPKLTPACKAALHAFATDGDKGIWRRSNTHNAGSRAEVVHAVTGQTLWEGSPQTLWALEDLGLLDIQYGHSYDVIAINDAGREALRD